MSKHILSFMFCYTMFVASSTFANPNTILKEKETVLTAIEGMVYCQSCAYTGSWSLTGAKPLPSAKVGVSCKDSRNRVRYYKSIKTDNNGYFFCLLEGLNMKKYYKGELEKACSVRLISSPNSECNSLTNINGGIEGCLVRNVNKTLEGTGFKTKLYAVKPLAFHPSFCLPVPHP